MEGFDDMTATGEELVTLNQLKKYTYAPIVARSEFSRTFSKGNYSSSMTFGFTVDGLYSKPGITWPGTYKIDIDNYLFSYNAKDSATYDALISGKVRLLDMSTYSLGLTPNQSSKTTRITVSLTCMFNSTSDITLNLTCMLVASVIGYDE